MPSFVIMVHRVILMIAAAIATSSALRLSPRSFSSVASSSTSSSMLLARQWGSRSSVSSISNSRGTRNVVSSSGRRSAEVTRLHAGTETADEEGGFDAAAWLNINTRGGIIVWSGILTLVPIVVYQYFIGQGYEDTTVGAYVGALFVLLSMVGWASTYIFRVATKDMTYAKQVMCRIYAGWHATAPK